MENNGRLARQIFSSLRLFKYITAKSFSSYVTPLLIDPIVLVVLQGGRGGREAIIKTASHLCVGRFNVVTFVRET